MLNGRLLGVSLTLALAASLLATSAASAIPIKMPTLSKEIAQQQAIVAAHKAINPPFSIVLGHEREETITDPGAEDIIGSGASAAKLGGWYDTIDANENGDKCAWVGEPLIGGLPGAPNVLPIPGAMGDIEGNAGTTFAVQSLWSNEAAAGTGYCAGAGTDLP